MLPVRCPDGHKQGGWAQARYQRHVQEHIDRHYKEVAAYIASYMTAHPHTHLILSGHNDIAGGLSSLAPPSGAPGLPSRCPCRNASRPMVSQTRASL